MLYHYIDIEPMMLQQTYNRDTQIAAHTVGAMIGYLLSTIAAGALLFAGVPAAAQHNHDESESHHSTSSHDTHVHGIAELLIVMEGEELVLELHSPAMNILGFEHKATSEEQIATLASARATLEDATALFQFDQGRCKLTSNEVSFSKLTEEAHEHEHHHEEHGDGNSEHHPTEGHSNVEALYSYRCENSGHPRALTTKIRDHFPGIEELQVQWIVKGRQGATTLDNEQNQVILK